ncbi:hypothetical protein HK100_011102 [Physocladia obscura]|uniref:Uncharacterized protein n=1 Tax=Physocladia obscura TaxID=109957 RepID=A0AAD5T4M4_9FUNG|nr:hypothetical protein HK100_011102 [Physocladia obscura]
MNSLLKKKKDEMIRMAGKLGANTSNTLPTHSNIEFTASAFPTPKRLKLDPASSSHKQPVYSDLSLTPKSVRTSNSLSRFKNIPHTPQQPQSNSKNHLAFATPTSQLSFLSTDSERKRMIATLPKSLNQRITIQTQNSRARSLAVSSDTNRSVGPYHFDLPTSVSQYNSHENLQNSQQQFSDHEIYTESKKSIDINIEDNLFKNSYLRDGNESSADSFEIENTPSRQLQQLHAFPPPASLSSTSVLQPSLRQQRWNSIHQKQHLQHLPFTEKLEEETEDVQREESKTRQKQRTSKSVFPFSLLNNGGIRGRSEISSNNLKANYFEESERLSSASKQLPENSMIKFPIQMQAYKNKESASLLQPYTAQTVSRSPEPQTKFETSTLTPSASKLTGSHMQSFARNSFFQYPAAQSLQIQPQEQKQQQEQRQQSVRGFDLMNKHTSNCMEFSSAIPFLSHASENHLVFYEYSDERIKDDSVVNTCIDNFSDGGRMSGNDIDGTNESCHVGTDEFGDIQGTRYSNLGDSDREQKFYGEFASGVFASCKETGRDPDLIGESMIIDGENEFDWF